MAVMKVEKYGIKITTGGNILPVLKATLPLLKAYESLKGMTGGAYYYYELPKNSINDWFVKEHQSRFKNPLISSPAVDLLPPWQSSEPSKKPNRPIRKSY